MKAKSHTVECPICGEIMSKSGRATSKTTGAVRVRFECFDCEVIRWQKIENGVTTIDQWKQRTTPRKEVIRDDYIVKPWFTFAHPWELRPCNL